MSDISSSPFCTVQTADVLPVQATPALLSDGTSAGTPTNWVDDDALEPIHFTKTCDGNISEAAIEVQTWHPEENNVYPQGLPVRIIEKDNPANVRWEGIITKVSRRWGSDDEEYKLIAHNRGDWILYATIAHGQYRLNHTNEQTYFTAVPMTPVTISPTSGCVIIDAPLVFNPEGLPNRTANFFINGSLPLPQTAYLFDIPYRKCTNNAGTSLDAEQWTLADAITYLLYMYSPRLQWALTLPLSTDIASVLNANNPVINDVNLNGMSIGQCLKTLLEPYGYGYKVLATTEGDGTHKLELYDKSNATETTVTLPVRNVNVLDPDQHLVDVISANLTFDATPVVNDVIGLGNYIEHTTELHTVPPTNSNFIKLSRAWKSADFDDILPALGPSWFVDGVCTGTESDKLFTELFCTRELITTINGAQQYAVGRVWEANTGDLNNATLIDLTTDFSTVGVTPVDEPNGIDHRPIKQPALDRKNMSGSAWIKEDIQVEMSINNGTNWNFVSPNWWKVLPDRMGIVFTEPDMSKDMTDYFDGNQDALLTYWDAVRSNSLLIRVICNVRSDRRLNAKNENTGDVMPIAVERLYTNDGFTQNKLNTAVAFNSLYVTNMVPYEDTHDDTPDLQTSVDRQKKNTNRLMISGTIEAEIKGTYDDTQDPWSKWETGNKITGIGNRMVFVNQTLIKSVHYDLINRRINVQVDSFDYRTVTRGKVVHDFNEILPVSKSYNYKPGDKQGEIDYENMQDDIAANGGK